MTLSIEKKQNYLYFIFSVFTVFLSVISYRFFEEKWLILKKADEKFREKSFDEAILLYQKSLAQGPTTHKAFLHLADSYVAEGNFAKGIEYYRYFLEKYPQDSAVRLLLARALSWNGNLKEAQEEYQKVLKRSSKEVQSADDK